MKNTITIALVFCCLFLNAQEENYPKNEIGINLQSAEYGMVNHSSAFRTNTVKLSLSRYLNPNLELRLNSNLNFSNNFYSLNSHAIGIYKYSKLKNRDQVRFGFQSKLRSYAGLELEYNKRNMNFEGDDPNQGIKANLVLGVKYDAFKRLSFFAESRFLSADVWKTNHHSANRFFPQVQLFNGWTAGAKIRF